MRMRKSESKQLWRYSHYFAFCECEKCDKMRKKISNANAMRMRFFSKSECECDANAIFSHRIASHSQNAKFAMRIHIPGHTYIRQDLSRILYKLYSITVYNLYNISLFLVEDLKAEEIVKEAIKEAQEKAQDSQSSCSSVASSKSSSSWRPPWRARVLCKVRRAVYSTSSG